MSPILGLFVVVVVGWLETEVMRELEEWLTVIDSILEWLFSVNSRALVL